MSLQEAHDRVEKLKNLMQSSNPHEAALAAARLKTFNVDLARYPKQETNTSNTTSNSETQRAASTMDVVDEMPDIPYRELGAVEVHQPPNQKKVNWDELHAELRERAQQIGADVLVNIQLKGTVKQRILCATALRYLSPVEIDEIKQQTKYEDDEKAYWEEQKERRDESFAPPID